MMEDRVLLSILDRKITESTEHQETELAKDRLTAEKYYLGQPFGNEVDGESTAVSRDVAEAVDAMLPSLLKMFTASGDVVRYQPVSPEDEESAQQASDYVSYLWNVKNQGFSIFHSWFKTALLKKRGVIKIWWEAGTAVRKERYYGLSRIELQMLAAQKDVTVELIDGGGKRSAYKYAANEAQDSFDAEASISSESGCIRIMPVPPDEFLIHPLAVDDETTTFTAHRLQKTISDLTEAGYASEMLERIASGSEIDSDERMHRLNLNGTYSSEADETDPSMRLVWVTECYLKVDYDEDGVAEMRRITVGGDGAAAEILDNEEVEHHPFASLCPFPATHSFWGESVFDKTRDIQEQKSVLTRQILNNLYHQNMLSYGVLDNQVNLDDALSKTFGKLVRMKRPDAIFPLPVNQIGSGPYNMLSVLDITREQRTGVRRMATGPGADTLQNAYTETLGGAQMVGDASAERLELVARIFAETGVKRAMKLILHLVTKYDQKAKILRLRGKWVPIDPRAWNEGMDLTVNVGLGSGNQQNHVATMMSLLAMDEKIIAMQGGVQGPVLTIQNVYNKFRKLAASSGLKDIEMYYTDPSTVKTPAPAAPPPDPVMIAVQGKIAADNAKLQADVQADMAKLQSANQAAIADIQLKMQVEQMRIASDGEKAQLSAQTELQKAEMAGNTKIITAQIAADAKDATPDTNNSPDSKADGDAANTEMLAGIMQALAAIHDNIQENTSAIQQIITAPRRIVFDKAGKVAGVQVGDMDMMPAARDESGRLTGLN